MQISVAINYINSPLIKIRSITRKIIMFWNSKKIWSKPNKRNVVIFDREGSDVLLRYIKKNDVEILDVRGERINVYVLFQCLLSFNIRRGSYAKRYISIVKPSVIITFIDNNISFYKLKNSYPSAITISIQNGLRTNFRHLFGEQEQGLSINNYNVDYILAFGSSVGRKYNEYIKGEIVSIGSIRNNLSATYKCAQDKTLVFISQVGIPPKNIEEPNYIDIGDRAFSWNEFYHAEKIVVKYLSSYCEKENMKFQICGRGQTTSVVEYNFFNELIGNQKWKFIPGNEVGWSYEVIDRAEFVVGIDSTLLYESLVRGNKTGVFSIRGNMLFDLSRNFGWPEEIPDSGPFWTNSSDEREFDRVLKYLSSVSTDEWSKVQKYTMSNIMVYNPGNTHFISLLNQLGVQLNERYNNHVQ